MSIVPYRTSTGTAIGTLARLAYNNRAPIRYAARTVGDMVRRGYRNFANRQRSMRKSKLRSFRRAPPRMFSGQGVTNQHDVSNIYRKGRINKRRRKKWKSFVSRVHAVSEKELGSRTVVFNNLVTISNNTSGQTTNLTTCLYSLRSNQNWLDDLNTIAALENAGDPTAAAGVTVDPTTKFMFQSGVLDLTVRNSSFQNDATSVGAKMEVDIYEMMMSKDAIDGTTAFVHASQLFDEADLETKGIGGGAGISIDSRGATPWDLTHALSRFGIKILSKKKYFVEAGGTFTYQARDPRRHVSTQIDMDDREGFNKKKWTKICYIVGKLVPGFTVGSLAGEFTEQLTVGCTRKYLYKLEGASAARDRYIAATATVTSPR